MIHLEELLPELNFKLNPSTNTYHVHKYIITGLNKRKSYSLDIKKFPKVIQGRRIRMMWPIPILLTSYFKNMSKINILRYLVLNSILS